MVNLREFNTGPALRYPITVSRIHKRKGDKVKRQEAVLQYTYKFKRTIGDPDLGEEREIEETGYGDWDCPSDGTVHKWHVNENDVIQRDQLLVVIDEPCSHDTQFAGLCTKCGKDMTESNWAAEGLDVDRATISMVHDNVALKVSATEAEKKELELQERLLTQKKLSLVVDLDQTVIHACVEPTIGEWQRDPSNPNYESVKEVRSFQLDDGPKHDDSPKCSYYIKLRPGLAGFLDRISELYEMHIYTMGTRAYAKEIAKIIDPEQKYFGNRIISRDENGSLAAKRLQRLFPVSTHMVVVIDDRADVWPMNRSNLIKVAPYDFFRGIGDINSSFLPKREDLLAPSPAPVPLQPNGGASANPNIPAPVDTAPEHERPVEVSDDENALLQLQAQEQERELAKQLTERPLMHLQEELDKEDTDMEDAEPSTEIAPAPAQNGHVESPAHRHNLLRDDDEELFHLEKHLTVLHQNFYNQHESRVAAVRKETGSNEITADSIPDVGKLLEWIKKRVLRGCSIALSGLVPLGIDVHRSELGLQIQSFGGEIRTRISKSVTHLVISSSRPRTQKVRQAARVPEIKIVNQDWLAGSLAQWKQLDVEPFLVEVHPSDRVSHTPVEASGRESESLTPAHPEEAENGEGPDEDGADESGGDDGPDEDEDGEVQDVYGVMPAEPEDGGHSPVDGLKTMDWGEMDAELDEFMGSDAGTDSEAETDFESDASTTGLKRGRDDEEDEGSALAKKQKLARDRTTGLRNVKNATEDGSRNGSSLPTPMGTGDDGEDDELDEDDIDLEAQLEAELAAEAEEAE
ncbi:RNA polymerase II subunit A C-terminal domain phosphatase [Pestalotiopsis sp. NC0098]|nr:RNA polymerase II subunit A C-terminal domain phosphatase [Pestalotiopsis sp. NC0098]